MSKCSRWTAEIKREAGDGAPDLSGMGREAMEDTNTDIGGT